LSLQPPRTSSIPRSKSPDSLFSGIGWKGPFLKNTGFISQNAASLPSFGVSSGSLETDFPNLLQLPGALVMILPQRDFFSSSPKRRVAGALRIKCLFGSGLVWDPLKFRSLSPFSDACPEGPNLPFAYYENVLPPILLT